MNVTSALFEAFLKCPTKCYLRSTGQAGGENAYAEWVRVQNDAYRSKTAKRVIEAVADTEGSVASPAAKDLKTAAWRLAVDLHVKAGAIESRIHAVERQPPQGQRRPAQFIPIRFTFFNKLTKDDPLSVAFDALVLSEVLGRDVSLGKIIHGDNHASLKVKIPTLLPKARKISEKISALLASASPPDLILNRHCEECEFRDRCRQKALEKDDLSLLGGMSAKERQKFRNKGFFTVTQLSYTFRPRRRPKRQRDKREKYHHALKALAIREKKIHIIGSPEFKIEGTPVYLDVEALPDRDFYYLIGLRIGDGEATVQHSLWADTVEEEGKIWREFLAILETVEKPVLIHYGSYETTFARSMRKRYGDAGAGIAATALDAMVNVLSFVFAQIYFPSHSNSLKDLASCLGFAWPDTALFGPNSIRFRIMWERSHETAIRESLISYNVADCKALQCLCNHLSALPQDRSTNPQTAIMDLVNVDEMKPLSRFHLINKDGAALPAFKTINKAAYWDYQRTRVYVRSSKIIKKASRQKSWVRAKRLRTERTVRYPAPTYCSRCGGTDLFRRRARNLLMHDIRFMGSGAKGWLTRVFIDDWFCRHCGCLVRPPGIGAYAVRKFGPHLRAYAMYQLIQLRVSAITVAESLSQLFHFNLNGPHISDFKSDFAEFYTKTVEELRTRIARGSLVHADETKVRLISKSGYVWVLASMEEVVFFYSDTREGDMVQELLKDFRGVLVSDFYAVYDAINCSQQKCLIHLMRDINDDLHKHPYDEDLRNIAIEYANLIRPMVETIDKHGLKKWFLTRHVPEVEKFFRWLSTENFDSETAQGYQKRFEKNRGKLFTFLAHDGVPWNNNNAENAIRAFAELRRVIGGTSTEKGLREYLVLLSICETCKRRGINFLDFMLSGKTNIEEFVTGRSSQIKSVRENERQWKKPQRRLPSRGSIGHKSGSRVSKGKSFERRDDYHPTQVQNPRSQGLGREAGAASKLPSASESCTRKNDGTTGHWPNRGDSEIDRRGGRYAGVWPLPREVSAMPQLQLPMFPEGVTHITNQLAVMKKDGQVTYFNGHMPVFSHDETDIQTFRMITSQFCVSGHVKQSDIIRAFGVTSISVKRSVKTYREKGPKGFYAPRVRRGAAVLVEDVVGEIEGRLAGGATAAEIAKDLGLKLNTIQKAMRKGRIRAPIVAKKREAHSRHKQLSSDGGQLDVVRVINDRCKVRTHDGRRAVIVSGIVLAEYSLGDRVGEAYAMVTLVEQGLADQNDVAQAFDCSTRTVRRYQRRFEDGGVEALGDGRGKLLLLPTR